MRILMIAPEPFFEPRGTPFSVLGRLRALSELGHQVDLVTYHLGEDVEVKNVTIHRSQALTFYRRVKIGPSWAKIALDGFLFLKALRLLWRGGYDVVHTHEEAAYFGSVLRMVAGMPHLYDMHSSLPEHLCNYRFLPFLRGLADFGERWVLRRSDAVIVVYPRLQELVRRQSPETRAVLVENMQAPLDPEAAHAMARLLRQELRLGDHSIILYTGNFERNQGIEMLLQGVPVVLARHRNARFVLVGGEPDQVRSARDLAQSLKLGDEVIFVGKRPSEQMPGFLALADVLLSPRTVGTNTPLKIYSYLAAGKPIVATRIAAHTQVLDETVALLTDVSPSSFGDAVIRLISDPDLRERLGTAAAKLARDRYTWAGYLERVQQAYETLRLAHASARKVDGVLTEDPTVSVAERRLSLSDREIDRPAALRREV
jgi:glycosyltransferase involved in cell wall biosynthesis